jgi:hypothetical protein
MRQTMVEWLASGQQDRVSTADKDDDDDKYMDGDAD